MAGALRRWLRTALTMRFRVNFDSSHGPIGGHANGGFGPLFSLARRGMRLVKAAPAAHLNARRRQCGAGRSG